MILILHNHSAVKYIRTAFIDCLALFVNKILVVKHVPHNLYRTQFERKTDINQLLRKQQSDIYSQVTETLYKITFDVEV